MKKGRPLEHDPEEVLEVAMNVFWEKGYESTTLGDLLEATKISRSSFYHAYGNKFQLFEQCLDLFCDKQIVQMENRLKQSLTGRVFIESFLYDLTNSAREADEPRFGSFVMNAHEFGGRDIYVSQLASSAILRFSRVLQTAIKMGQSEGVINKEKDPDSLALFLMSSIAGIRTMISAKVPLDRINKIIEVTLSALD
jgi:TetR/AcrR family transcriptional regulator, transcriptional repressor for nem operon